MNIRKQIAVAVPLFITAVVTRFSTMNTSVDLTTVALLTITLLCGFTVSMVSWSLWGFVLEASFLAQVGPAGIMYFTVIPPILTCITIGLTVSVLKLALKKDKFLLFLPVIAYLAKWELAFFQDLYLLALVPSMAPVWVSYHIQTEIWALSKCVQAVVYTVPVWMGFLAYGAVKKSKSLLRPCPSPTV